MSKTLISESEYLFALCITDGMLDDYPEEQRMNIILEINNIKETMLREITQSND